MAIIKRSEARIDMVYENKNNALKAVAARSLRCARCGTSLDPSAKDPMVTCVVCGYITPRMMENARETNA